MYREIKFNAFNKETGEMMYNVGFDNTCKNGDNGIIFLQYIGLKDKNGKEIYEGDILKGFMSWEQIIGIVKIGQCSCEEYNAYGPNIDGENLDESISGDFEIIGNVYENPDLLTK